MGKLMAAAVAALALVGCGGPLEEDEPGAQTQQQALSATQAGQLNPAESFRPSHQPVAQMLGHISDPASIDIRYAPPPRSPSGPLH